MKMRNFEGRKISRRPTIDDPEEIRGLYKNFERRETQDRVPLCRLRSKNHIYKFQDDRAVFALSQKLSLVYNLQNLTGLSIYFTAFISARYEFEPALSSRIGFFLSLSISLLTLLFVSLAMIERFLQLEIYRNEQEKPTDLDLSHAERASFATDLLFAFHPNFLFFRQKGPREPFIDAAGQYQTFHRNINEYLFLFQITALLFKAGMNIFNDSDYGGQRVKRLTRIFRLNCTRKFVLKCHIEVDMLKILTLFIVLFAFYFTLAFAVVEAPLTLRPDRPPTAFRNPFDLFESWSFVTASALLYGTGDIVVASHLGKCFAIASNYIGAFLIPAISFSMERRYRLIDIERSVVNFKALPDLVVRQEQIVRSMCALLNNVLRKLPQSPGQAPILSKSDLKSLNLSARQPRSLGRVQLEEFVRLAEKYRRGVFKYRYLGEIPEKLLLHRFSRNLRSLEAAVGRFENITFEQSVFSPQLNHFRTTPGPSLRLNLAKNFGETNEPHPRSQQKRTFGKDELASLRKGLSDDGLIKRFIF